MSLFLFSNLSHTMESALIEMAVNEGLEAKTFKKDRGILLVKRAENHFQLKQFGYVNTLHEGDVIKMKKALKKAIKKEFPRSHKVWLESYIHLSDDLIITPDNHRQGALF